MQKIGKRYEIGSYELELYPEDTAAWYDSAPVYQGDEVAFSFFCHLLPRASEESLAFLEEMGISPKKLFFARPLSEPDEKGEILYLCFARLCGRLLKGGETHPRQSEEKAGMSMIFLSDRDCFREGPHPVGEPQLEMRFVIPLPFDPDFFEGSQ